MADSSFPTGLDTAEAEVDLAAGTLDDIDGTGKLHSSWMRRVAHAIVQLEAKVGADSSAVTSSHDYKLAQLASTYQPLDSDLTAIAALTTTAYGRAFLALANQAALMALMSSASDSSSGIVELATSAETITGTDTARAVTPAGAAAAYQPLDSDLTAIAALSTTSFGRGLLALADAAAARTSLDVDQAGTAATLLAAHTGDTSDAHDASAVSVDSTTLAGTGTDVQAVLEELDNSIASATALINTLAPGWYVPAGSLDRWLLTPDPILRAVILGDSVMQDTVSQADGWPNRLGRGLGGLRSDDVISSGAGYYHLLRHGGQNGAGNTAYEWWRCGPVGTVWSAVNALHDYDLCLYNTWAMVAPTSTYIHRQVTDGVTTANSRTVTSATGAFDATSDIGALIKTSNLDDNTFIVKVNSSTSVEVSNPAKASGSGQTVTVFRGIEVFTAPLSAKPGQRMRFDAALTSGDATLTSASAVFTASDVGSSIAGTGIPAGTTIASYTSATSVEMSANASATVTGGLLIIAPKGGRAVVDAVTSAADATLTSAGAAFTPADIGKRITGSYIGDGATIVSVNSATSIEMSVNSKGGATGGNLIIGDKTAPPIAELGIVYIGDSGNGTGFSYSINGGSTWARINPASHASDPAHLYLTNVAVTNPTTLILRNQDGTTNTSTTAAFKPAGVITRKTASATRGIEIINCGIDGAYLKTLTRENNLGTTVSATTTSGSTAITMGSAVLTTTYYNTARPITGPGIPAGTTVTRNGSDTAGTLSQAATASATVTVSTFVTAGDSFAMLDNTIGLGSITDSDLWQGWRPQLIIVGYSNDYLDHATKGENGYVNFLRRVRERTESYADMLVWIYYEQGGSRLDGTQCTGTDQSDYRAAIEAWCVSEGVAYFNAYRAFDEGEGLTGYADIAAAGYLVDTLHLDQPGSDNISARLRRGLTVFG